MAAKCRSCKADIVWVRMPSGKAMPVNPKPVTMIRVSKQGPMRTIGEPVQVHESHFATCPNAEEHRGTAA